MNSMKLYGRYFSMHIKSMMQHKVSFLLTVLGQFLVSFNVFLGVYFMMERFHKVNGFTYPQVLLCFSIMLMAFTLAETFFRSFDLFNVIIGNGEFDRILLRPRGAILQVLGSKIELTRIGRLLQALVMLLYAVPRSGVTWNMLKLLTLLLMIVCGSLVFAAIFVIFAGICFFTIENLEFMNIFTDGAREYGKYPIGVYGKTVRTICTFVVPFALFQYYPFLYLIGASANCWFCLLPLVSCLFLLPAGLLWNFGLSRYQSTGS